MGAESDLNARLDLANTIDCIRIAISDQYACGSDITRVKLSDADAQHVEAIEAALEVEGRTFQFDESTMKLTIDSSGCPSE